MSNLKLRCRGQVGPVFGTCCLSTSPEFLAATLAAGLDFVFIDTEHVAIPRDKLSWMCRAYAGANVSPIVRVPEPEPFRVCEYIDGGAQGIVAPYVETVDQVLSLVGAVKLRPLKGARLEQCLEILKLKVTSILPSDSETVCQKQLSVYEILESTLGSELTSYLQTKNKDSVLLINVESVPALDILPSLLSVPGLDGVFIGPADLSVSLGIPRQWHNEKFHTAVTSIIQQTSRRGLSVGCHYSFDKAIEYQTKWIKEGADMVVHASDVSLFANILKEDMKKLRSSSLGYDDADRSCVNTSKDSEMDV